MKLKEDTFEYQCDLCGQMLKMRFGVLHDCPGDADGPPGRFLPFPNLARRLGFRVPHKWKPGKYTKLHDVINGD